MFEQNRLTDIDLFSANVYSRRAGINSRCPIVGGLLTQSSQMRVLFLHGYNARHAP